MEVKKRKKEYVPYKVINNNKVVIMWDYTPIYKTNAMGVEIETPLATWQEYTFDYIPSLNEIKCVICDFYNKQIDEKIINGLVWKDMKIHLSTENQFNYKAMYDLAIQTNGEILPLTFKFSKNDEDNVYYEFKTIEDLSNFYLTSIKHIQKTLSDGWLKKDSIKWNFYQK